MSPLTSAFSSLSVSMEGDQVTMASGGIAVAGMSAPLVVSGPLVCENGESWFLHQVASKRRR